MSFKIFAALTLSSLLTSAALAQSSFQATLRSVNETPSNITRATGNAHIRIINDGQSIEYALTYSGLEGGKALVAHIHVGQPNVAGGVSVFFCGGGNSDATKAACPESATTPITGTWTAADIVGPAGQGLDPKNGADQAFAKLVQAIRAGLTYANVHTMVFPAGEIRGQFKPGGD